MKIKGTHTLAVPHCQTSPNPCGCLRPRVVKFQDDPQIIFIFTVATGACFFSLGFGMLTENWCITFRAKSRTLLGKPSEKKKAAPRDGWDHGRLRWKLLKHQGAVRRFGNSLKRTDSDPRERSEPCPWHPGGFLEKIFG